MPATTVYLLDDDEQLQERLGAVLRAAGFRTYGCTLWSQMAQWLGRSRAGAVLVSELDLSGIPGEDFCRTIRTHHPHVELVLYTDVDPEAASEAAARLGGVPWVPKSRGPDALLEVLRRLRERTESGEHQPAATTYLIGTPLPRPLAIGARPVTVGRHADRDIVLSSILVSRLHASVSRDGDAVEVQDHGSRNGILVDGAPVDGVRRVARDATIEVGNDVLEVVFGRTWPEAAALAEDRFASDTRAVERFPEESAATGEWPAVRPSST